MWPIEHSTSSVSKDNPTPFLSVQSIAMAKNIKVFHIAEVLAGMADGPAIGEAERES